MRKLASGDWLLAGPVSVRRLRRHLSCSSSTIRLPDWRSSPSSCACTCARSRGRPWRRRLPSLTMLQDIVHLKGERQKLEAEIRMSKLQ